MIERFVCCRQWAVALLLGLCSPLMQAAEFSGDAYVYGPGGWRPQAHVVVKGDRMRTEMQTPRGPVIEIVDPASGTTTLLWPAGERYAESRPPVQQPASFAPVRGGADDPCSNRPGMRCERQGDATVHGRPATRWQIATEGERPLFGLIWLDRERGIPLRQFHPDGTITEARPTGEQEVEGRKTEIWEITLLRPDGAQQRSLQWYDPELGIAVREQLPDGQQRELRNIEIGPQPDERFEIPPGYQPIDAPPQRAPADRQAPAAAANR